MSFVMYLRDPTKQKENKNLKKKTKTKLENPIKL